MYVPVAGACDEPNSETPLTAAQVANQDAMVSAVGGQFINGNAGVYDLVQALGGHLPGLVPGSPPAAPAPNVPPAAPVYSAPGVPWAPPFNDVVPPWAVGGSTVQPGVDVGPAIASLVYGCNPASSGLSVGQGSGSPVSDVMSSGWFWGGLGLAFTLWWLGSKGGYRR